MVTQPFLKQRKISKAPFKVLDAPHLQDDFYLNLVDWSSSDLLAVGLGSCIYLWSATSGKVNKLRDFGENEQVTSVSWQKSQTLESEYLAVGT